MIENESTTAADLAADVPANVAADSYESGTYATDPTDPKGHEDRATCH